MIRRSHQCCRSIFEQCAPNKKKRFRRRMTDVFSFAHRPRTNKYSRGIVCKYDTTVGEAIVQISRGENKHYCRAAVREPLESVARIVERSLFQEGSNVWIDCEVTDGGEATQFFLCVDEEGVDREMSDGCFEAEEDIVMLAKSVWREARVAFETTPVGEERSQGSAGDPADETCAAWNETEYPLFPEQRATVRWMRETEEEFPKTLRYAGNMRVTKSWWIDTENECFTTEPSMREAEAVGGICANGMGRGKTAIALLLIAETMRTPRARGEYESDATLVILPVNLVHQWKTEMDKFVPEGKMRVLFVQGKDVRSYTMRQACDDFDIVVCTFQFLRQNRAYADLVDQALGGKPRERSYLVPWTRKSGRTECVLEAIRWRRIIVDEMHDVVERSGDMRHLQLFRPFALWGLTATPSLHNGSSQQQLYALLSREKTHHPNLLAEVASRCVCEGRRGVPRPDGYPRAAAKRSAPSSPVWRARKEKSGERRACKYRKGTSSPDDEEAEEARHVTRFVREVHLSAEERLRLSSVDGGSLVEKVQNITFVDDPAPRGDAKVRRPVQVRTNEKRLAVLKARVESHARTVRVLEAASQDMLRMLEDEEDDGDSVLRAAYDANIRDLEVARQLHNVHMLHLTRREDFLSTVNKRIADIHASSRGLCGACSAASATALFAYPCLHVFCESCSSTCGPFSCPVCGTATTDVVPVSGHGGLGSKLSQITDLVVSSVRNGARVLLFVQWKSMVRPTRSFLQRRGASPQILEGNSTYRERTLRSLRDQGGVLLLCLEDGFAGLHLPFCRVVVFAHAIVGDLDLVSRLERQAIARCDRYGQDGEIEIHSFLGVDTEEALLYDRTHG